MALHEALKYVLGAYSVFLVLLVAYGAIMATRTGRVRRELAELRRALGEGKR
ncbi:MAG TPA: hypothetical protein VFL87_02220 [Thermoleophilaceae bacterium]|nr:hypothetical protein [Thermoleophilaceae bacterium]